MAKNKCAISEIDLKPIYLTSIQSRCCTLADRRDKMSAGYRSKDAGVSPIKPGSYSRSLDILWLYLSFVNWWQYCIKGRNGRGSQQPYQHSFATPVFRCRLY